MGKRGDGDFNGDCEVKIGERWREAVIQRDADGHPRAVEITAAHAKRLTARWSGLAGKKTLPGRHLLVYVNDGGVHGYRHVHEDSFRQLGKRKALDLSDAAVEAKPTVCRDCGATIPRGVKCESCAGESEKAGNNTLPSAEFTPQPRPVAPVAAPQLSLDLGDALDILDGLLGDEPSPDVTVETDANDPTLLHITMPVTEDDLRAITKHAAANGLPVPDMRRGTR